MCDVGGRAPGFWLEALGVGWGVFGRNRQSVLGMDGLIVLMDETTCTRKPDNVCLCPICPSVRRRRP